MDRTTTTLVDGLGAAAATSGVITQLQGRIFAFLYLQERPVSLDDIAAALEQSKSTISVTIRGLVEWHLVRRVPTPGTRKDHYEAVTNFWRLMQEIMERRFRWNLRQVVATAEEAKRAADEDYRSRPSDREKAEFIDRRLAALGSFFAAVDVGIGAFTKGNAITPEALQKAVPPALSSTRSRPVH